MACRSDAFVQESLCHPNKPNESFKLRADDVSLLPKLGSGGER